jgi:transcriptional regulator with XRE-family HTH domain
MSERARTVRRAQPEAPAVNHAPGPDEAEHAHARPRAERGRPGPLPRSEEIPRAQAAVVGANIRALRHRHGLTQAQLGALMGWPTITTVCAAEGRRGGQQRGFTTTEVTRLASIFDTTTAQLLTRCAHCEGHPPPGYACLTCGTQAAHEPVASTR